MIPFSRPVVGKDLDAIRQQFGLLTSDACFVFGLSITRWMQIVRQKPDEPVKDPTLALMVRFLEEHPETLVIPDYPTVPDMYEYINSIQTTDQKRFSILFGSEASAAYRWLRSNSRQSPAVSRLMHLLKVALNSRSPAQKWKLIESWSKIVAKEGVARGIPDVFAFGKWNPVAEDKAKVEATLTTGPKLTRKKGLAAVKKVKQVEADALQV